MILRVITLALLVVFGGVTLAVRVMVFNATFNNISAISRWSVLFVVETRVLQENQRPATSQTPFISQWWTMEDTGYINNIQM